MCVCVCLTYLPRTFIWQHHEWHRGLYTFQGPKHTRVLAKHWLKTPKTSCFTILRDQRSGDLKGLQKLLYIWGHSSPRKYKQKPGCVYVSVGRGGCLCVCDCVCFLCVLGCVWGCALGCVGCVIKQYYPIFPLFAYFDLFKYNHKCYGPRPYFWKLVWQTPTHQLSAPPPKCQKNAPIFQHF